MDKKLIYGLFEEMLQGFSKNEVAPIAAQIDEEERFPSETVEKMAAAGLLGIIVPERYGGAGGDYYMYIKAVEELSKACASTGVILSAHTSLCVAPILEFGSEEQKQKYLPQLSTDKLGAFGLTEPNAGSDASGQQTFAVLDGDNYIINGAKTFITNAGPAMIYIVFAMTDKSKGTRGISAFIIEKGTPGFSIGKEEKKLGIRASSTCELIFENCVIPKENLLGKEGDGFKIAMRTLDGGRIGIAAQALGIAGAALEHTVKYVKERVQFNKPLSANQNTQFVLADMKTHITAASHLVYDAAKAKDENAKDVNVRAAMAKLFASETAMNVTVKAVQQYGGYGYMRDYPVERLMRDAKITEIYEGTSEIQRMVISVALLK